MLFGTFSAFIDEVAGVLCKKYLCEVVWYLSEIQNNIYTAIINLIAILSATRRGILNALK